MQDRREQLFELYGVHFPDEMFMLWDWYQSQPSEIVDSFRDLLGLGLVGPFDVLAGRFDGVELRYPFVMHFRFHQDPPEFITVMGGDTDGLHWGYWFDDPERLAPVVACWYARDAFDLWTAGSSLIETIHRYVDEAEEGIEENLDDEPEYADKYEEELEALAMLRAALPAVQTTHQRVPTHQTPEGMGIVAEGSAELISEFLSGKQLWFEGEVQQACTLLEPVYRELGREPLAAIVRAIQSTPYLPTVDLIDYQIGSDVSE